MMKLHIFFKLDKKIIGNEGLNCLKKIEGRNALKKKGLGYCVLICQNYDPHQRLNHV